MERNMRNPIDSADLFVALSIALYSTDHYIGATVALAIFVAACSGDW